MTHDENEYPDAHSFVPERFLDPEKPQVDPRSIVFGFGRRYVSIVDPRIYLRPVSAQSRVSRFMIDRDTDIFISMLSDLSRKRSGGRDFLFDYSHDVGYL